MRDNGREYHDRNMAHAHAAGPSRPTCEVCGRGRVVALDEDAVGHCRACFRSFTTFGYRLRHRLAVLRLRLGKGSL